MTVSLREVRELLDKRANGELSPEEQGRLLRDARILRRRIERLRALDPDLFAGVALSEELDELAQPPVLSA